MAQKKKTAIEALILKLLAEKKEINLGEVAYASQLSKSDEGTSPLPI